MGGFSLPSRPGQSQLRWEPWEEFPNPPALWLRRAKLGFANALRWEPWEEFPNPPALWLRRAKLGFANALRWEP
jgi:hypothetical protein